MHETRHASLSFNLYKCKSSFYLNITKLYTPNNCISNKKNRHTCIPSKEIFSSFHALEICYTYECQSRILASLLGYMCITLEKALREDVLSYVICMHAVCKFVCFGGLIRFAGFYQF